MHFYCLCSASDSEGDDVSNIDSDEDKDGSDIDGIDQQIDSDESDEYL